MINSKRILRIKKDIAKKIGKIQYIKFNVIAKEGIYLFNLYAPGDYNQSKFKKIDKIIDNLPMYDCSEYGVNEILIVGDGKSKPVFICGDIPYKDKIKEGFEEDPERPFKNFNDNELKTLADIN